MKQTAYPDRCANLHGSEQHVKAQPQTRQCLPGFYEAWQRQGQKPCRCGETVAEMLTVPHHVNLAGQFHASTMKLVRKQTELL